MNHIMEETPGKILGLLVTACTSMLMLFLVSSSNMSFNGSEMSVPDPFAPQKVVAVLDNVSNIYSKFLAANLFNPAKSDYAFWSESISWVWGNSSPRLADMLGVHLPPPGVMAGQVAGAYTSRADDIRGPSSGGLSVDSLYSLLIR